MHARVMVEALGVQEPRGFATLQAAQPWVSSIVKTTAAATSSPTAGHAPRSLDQLQACLAGHFDVEHSTFRWKPPLTPGTKPARPDQAMNQLP